MAGDEKAQSKGEEAAGADGVGELGATGRYGRFLPMAVQLFSRLAYSAAARGGAAARGEAWTNGRRTLGCPA